MREASKQQVPGRRLGRRRGIVLLVVISLLALFILMGITFALVSNQYQYASKLDKEVERLGDLPRGLRQWLISNGHRSVLADA